MRSRSALKRLSCILLGCMAVSIMVISTGCIPPTLIKKMQPTLGHWVYEKDPVTGVEHKIGCNAGGNECAYFAVGCTKVEIPLTLAQQLIEWQSNAAL